MGTYTVNYNLYMPTVGEQGWGELVNGNFTTIDTTMGELNTRVGTLEPLSVIQVDENKNVTFPVSINAKFNTKLTKETGVISGVYFNNDITLDSITGNAGRDSSYVYKANPLCNEVTFTIAVATGNNGTKTGNGYVKVNGTEILSHSYSGANYTSTKSATVTLNDGDEITAYVYSNYGSTRTSLTLNISGYLVNT